jgi:hypothetical protein
MREAYLVTKRSFCSYVQHRLLEACWRVGLPHGPFEPASKSSTPPPSSSRR